MSPDATVTTAYCVADVGLNPHDKKGMHIILGQAKPQLTISDPIQSMGVLCIFHYCHHPKVLPRAGPN